MQKNVRIITIVTLSLLGVLCISSGILYSKMEAGTTNAAVLVVVQTKRVNKEADITIKLKDFVIETNTALSVKIVDYIDGTVSDEVLAGLTLDTSNVNVTQAGDYQYSIKYNDKVFTGKITVKEKENTNQVPTITLKPFNIKLGTILSTDIATYLIETVPEEIKATMKLDLSQVNVNQAGTYQYMITYNNSVYTSTITVTEDQPTLSTKEKEEAEVTPPMNPEKEQNQTT